MLMVRKIILSLLTAGMFISVSAQETTPTDSVQVEQPSADSIQVEQAPAPKETKPAKEANSFKDKIYYGGNVGMSFGSYTMFGIYPMVGYKLTPKLSAGVTFNYQWIQDKRGNTTFESSNYGGSIFSRFRILKPIYLHAEYVQQSYELILSDGKSEREWVPFFLVGGGFSKSVGKRTWLNAQVLFDVLQDDNSPYREWEPFYSVGIGVGF